MPQSLVTGGIGVNNTLIANATEFLYSSTTNDNKNSLWVITRLKEILFGTQGLQLFDI